MDIDEKYMQDALREARTALEEGEVPIGAVVVCRGAIIGKGHNMTERLHDQIGRVVYGAGDPKRGQSLYSPPLLHPRTELRSGVLASECTELMLSFFRDKRG